MITKLLKSLAEYYHQENDLSNVVCILCNIDTDFRDEFLRFFFPNLNLNDISPIEREKIAPNSSDSRVDLYFECDGDPYIIEVKIGDNSHHFGQYDKAYGVTKDRFGYITNYYCLEGKLKNYEVKEWEELYHHLSLNNKTKNSKTIDGFLAYLKEVCTIIDETIHNVGDDIFLKTISDGILKHAQSLAATNLHKMEISGIVQRRENCAVNFYVSFPPRDSDRNFVWCGVKPFDDDKQISFYVELANREHHHKPSLSEKLLKFDSGVYAEAPVKTDGYVYFKLKQNKQFDFNNARDYLSQKQILREFINEITLLLTDILSE